MHSWNAALECIKILQTFIYLPILWLRDQIYHTCIKNLHTWYVDLLEGGSNLKHETKREIIIIPCCAITPCTCIYIDMIMMLYKKIPQANAVLN